jgi:phosphotransferase system HPr-like phosphotransfer protein
MKLSPLAILLLWQAIPRVAPEPRHFRYERAITVPAGASGPVCATLDGTVYAHSPTLSDVRLYAGTQEIPYAQLTSQAATIANDDATILNLGEQHGHIVFDLAMPARPYSIVNLALTGQDFIVTARVSGVDGKTVDLGTFTLFDLTAQRLGRSTSLPLAESTFPRLHIDLSVTPAPGHPGFKPSPAMVASASIPPSREAQTLYTTVVESSEIKQSGRRTLVTLKLPANVPVERVSFDVDPRDKTNFSRAVVVSARNFDGPQRRKAEFLTERLTGEISRVKLTTGGKEIDEESLSVLATLGTNAGSDAEVTVAIENEDDRPIALRAVRLEMRQRKLCFDAPAEPVTLYYGDDSLRAPFYDYSRLFQPTAASTPAQLEPEEPNPLYVPRTIERSFTERHPAILWAALLAVVAVLGTIAFRSAKTVT